MSFLTKRLTKDQSLALGRVAKQVRQSLDGGSLVPELPQSVHGLLREPTETHAPDETLRKQYEKDLIAIKHKVMEVMNQGGERENFCEEVDRHLDQLSNPKARAVDAAARREENISAGVHVELVQDIITSKVVSADRLTRSIRGPRLLVRPKRQLPSTESSFCDPPEPEAPLLDDPNTNAGRDNMAASALSAPQAHQVTATSNVIVIPDEEDTLGSIASASSQPTSNRHPVSAPDAPTLSKLDNTSAMAQPVISGCSSAASAVQFLAGTDTTAAQAVDQQSRISATKDPISLDEEGILALQKQSEDQRVVRHVCQQTARSPLRTKQYGRQSLSRRSPSHPTAGHWAKRRKIIPEKLARDAHPILTNNNSLTGPGGTSNSVGITQFPSGSEQVDMEAEARDTSTISLPPHLNSSRPIRELGPQNPEGRAGIEPRDPNPINCDGPSNHGQRLELEPPITDLQAVAQPKSEELGTAVGFKTAGGDKEMSYTRSLLRKLVEVIKEVDVQKMASETQSDTQGEDPAETDAIYSMYVQFNEILHKQRRR
ncbi:unnamed protein product [Clonostachys byssicola]|uniref:Uncharacterized protein n=1 Tax=Clonostachys byssicola TaxID=160290 RepID=A0A9N9UKX5_9HYPO|nr:unnamed protein product [Clonostachys byssicola]